jgi:ATP-dependent Clp protease protease subunit
MIHAEEIIKTRRKLEQLYGFHTGQDSALVAKSLERDFFMTAEEAMRFGIVDAVLTSRKDTKNDGNEPDAS